MKGVKCLPSVARLLGLALIVWTVWRVSQSLVHVGTFQGCHECLRNPKNAGLLSLLSPRPSAMPSLPGEEGSQALFLYWENVDLLRADLLQFDGSILGHFFEGVIRVTPTLVPRHPG